MLTFGIEGWPQYNRYLIEGIGATNCDMLFCGMHLIPIPNSFLRSELISCHKDGVCLFSRDRFYEVLTGIKDTAGDNIGTGDDALYDLNGFPESTPSKGRVYIRNGRKIVW